MSTPRALSCRPALLAVVLLLPLLLQGCWTLERYVARVRIEPDGSYKYFLEGSATHTATAYALRRAEREARASKAKPEDALKLKQDAEAVMAKDLGLARTDPRVKSIQSVGGGRIRFMVSGTGSIAGGEIIFQEREAPLTYAQGPEGSLSIRLKDAVVGRNAGALGIKVDGDVSITLAEGIQVLEHNALKTPTVPGGAYRWRVEDPSAPAPHLVIRLPKP